jgi:hypothetical protein
MIKAVSVPVSEPVAVAVSLAVAVVPGGYRLSWP